MELAPAIALSLGFVLWTLLAISQRIRIRSTPGQVSPHVPPVSILKPLKGLEPHLDENLETFFQQDHPDFEIVFGAERLEDPAVAVARGVIARHPCVRASVVCHALRPGWNPKVSNLANALSQARHEVILISDSNIAAPSSYLRGVATALLRPGVGLVSSLFRGTRAEGLGGALESLQLNGFVTGSVSMVDAVLHRPCVVGKSMLLRRSDLEHMGGFAYLSRFLAEDQVCGEEIHKLGLATVVTGEVIDNVLGRKGIVEFADRHVRWSKIRRRICLPAYLLEILLNPTFLALLGAATLRTAGASAALLFSIAGMSVFQAILERGVGVRRSWWSYPLLEVARATITGVTWVLPLLSTRVFWRGTRVSIGPRTLILPSGPAAPAPLAVPGFAPRAFSKGA